MKISHSAVAFKPPENNEWKESFVPEQNNIIDNKGLRRNALDEYNVKIKLWGELKDPVNQKQIKKSPLGDFDDVSFPAG